MKNYVISFAPYFVRSFKIRAFFLDWANDDVKVDPKV